MKFKALFPFALLLTLILVFFNQGFLFGQDRGSIYKSDPYLEDGFFYKKLPLGGDESESLYATLVSKRPHRPSAVAVLYIHGFYDYFFQSELADQFIDRKMTFYALDLRRCGRSFEPENQILSFSTNFENYYEEISMAIDQIKEEGHGTIILMGHSTGGLIAVNFVADLQEKSEVDYLVLNSPFLAFSHRNKKRGLATFAAGTFGLFFPRAMVGPELSPLYGKSIHQSHFGEWQFDTLVKPINAPRVKAGWIKAVRKAQRNVVNENKINIPILVLHSDKSLNPQNKSDEIMTADIVLDVEHIKNLSPKLGENVSMEEVEDAIHDVFLSSKKVRQSAYETLFDWLENELSK